MTAIPLPSNRNIRRIRLTAVDLVGEFASPLSGHVQFERRNEPEWGQFWRAEVELPAMTRADMAEWSAVFLRARQEAAAVVMGDPMSAQPQGPVAGSVTVLEGIQGQPDLTVQGFTAWSEAEWTYDRTDVTFDSETYTHDIGSADVGLRSGDYVELRIEARSWLYRLTEDSEIADKTTGRATLTLWPDLRHTFAGGEPVVYVNARGEFTLMTDPAEATALADIRRLPVLTLEEAIP